MESTRNSRLARWFAGPKETLEDQALAVLSATLDALVVIDVKGVVVEWNPSATEIFGYGRADALGQEIADLIIPDELRSRHRAGMAHYLATGEAPVFGERITMPAVRADGSELMVELSITPVNGQDEELFAGWLRDVTEIAEARASADRSSELLAAVLQNVSDFITIFAPDGSIRFASGGRDMEGVQALFGQDQQSWPAAGDADQDAGVASLLHPQDVDRAVGIFEAIVRGDRPANERWDMRTAEIDGVSRTFETTGENLIDHPTVQGVIFSSRDVTEERASQALIVAAETSARKAAEDQAAALREVAVLKSELLAMVSHELRTPLTAILSFAEILSSRLGAVSDGAEENGGGLGSQLIDQRSLSEAQDMVLVIERNGQLLTRLVDDLLLVGQLESGAISIIPKEFDVRSFVETFMAGVLPVAESLGVEISVATRGTEPAWGDPARVTQVLQNLVSNAFKFAPTVTHVAIQATLSDEGWTFSVTDDGPGIPDGVQSQIFDKFFRGPHRSTVSGTGLGLAVSQAIVELHGGEIGVSSVVGHGSTFAFNLPRGFDHE